MKIIYMMIKILKIVMKIIQNIYNYMITNLKTIMIHILIKKEKLFNQIKKNQIKAKNKLSLINNKIMIQKNMKIKFLDNSII